MKTSLQISALLFLYFSISTPTFAQKIGSDSSAKVYDLNDFKFRYQRYRALEFDYRMSGNFITNRTDNGFNNDDSEQNGNFNLNASLVGNTFENSERLQRLQTFRAAVDLNSLRQELPDNAPSLTRSSNLFPFLGYENTSRKYDGNKFFLLDYRANILINASNSLTNTGQERNNNNTRFALGAGVGFGHGRVENVSDAVTSYFILRDLQQNGVLQNFTATQLENLADGIVKIRNDRYIGDNRFRFVDQITRLDSVCKASGIMAENPVALFTVLYDNLVFTSYFRETGRRHSFSLDANNTYSRSSQGNGDPFQVIDITLGPKYEYVNAVQKSMLFQRKTTATVSTGGLLNHFYGEAFTDESDRTRTFLRNNVSVNHGYVYQPNTRTIIDVSAFFATNLINNSELRNLSTSLGLRLNSNYFFSRRFSLFLNGEVTQNFTSSVFDDSFRDIDSRNRNFQLNFNSGLTYAFY